MEPIDLRSDTVTQPTKKMREAMALADVGDDVLDEDPTIHQLQDIAAEKLGKEAALFVPSGTMGNLVSLLTHCQRGDEVILGDLSHIFLNEVGGISALGGIHPRILANSPDGTIELEALRKAIRHDDLHYPPTRVICLENSHNYCSGSALSPDYMKRTGQLARDHNLKIHLDGARIFNAADALSVPVRVLAEDADSVMFCLSKGLSAPVGSLICGTEEFISKARKNRKMLGGGMRQSGHLAAAGIVALNDQVEGLATDRKNNQKLIGGLQKIDGITVRAEFANTNIVFFTLDQSRLDSQDFMIKLAERNIKLLMIEDGEFRAVLHRQISEEQVTLVLRAIREILA